MQGQELLNAKAKYHKGLSNYLIKADKRNGRLPEEYYNKILEEGMECSRCGFVVDKDTYGHFDQNPDEIKIVLCRYCTTIRGV